MDLRRRRLLTLCGAAGVAAVAAACGGGNSAGRSSGTSTASGAARMPSVAAPDAAGSMWLYLAILTGKMVGQSGWPEFVPANFTVPGNTAVQAEIRCFDDGTASIPSGYEVVRGTVGGNMTLISAVNGDLSKSPARTVQSVNAAGVAHTLTFADTGMNIPIPPLSTVRFSFFSGNAGTHPWQCMAACSTGQGGWGGAMSTSGWMSGTMTVQA